MLDVAHRLLFVALLAAAIPALAADPAPRGAPALLAALDADHDGRLTSEELHAARKQQVTRFDGNRDNRLSIEPGGWRRRRRGSRASSARTTATRTVPSHSRNSSSARTTCCGAGTSTTTAP
jgi:hypothetical protein